MGDLRAAVVGVGHLGRHHARILSELEGIELVALADPDEDRVRPMADQYGCRWQPDRSGLAEQVEMVVVATPTTRHLECAEEFLRAGVACLVEKPLAPDPATCEALLRHAEEGGAILGTGHVERFNPAIRRGMELGIEARFIEAHRLSAYSFRSTDVGVVLDLMIHDLDLALAWAGRPVESVDAVGGRVLSATEDIASVRLRFEGGLVANLTASRLSLNPMRRFRVFGPDCYLSLDSQKRYALLVQKAQDFGPEAVARAAESSNPVESFRDLLHTEELTLDDDEPLRAELRAFADAVRAGGPAPVSGEDGLRAVALADRIVAALRESSWTPEAAATLSAGS